MITAKNYASQAAHGLGWLSAQLHDLDLDDEIYNLNFVTDSIKESVKFAIPDGGRVFDDNLKGLLNTRIELPFPKVCVEYYLPLKTNRIEQKLGFGHSLERSSKAVILGIDGDLFKSKLNNPESDTSIFDDSIVLFPIRFYDKTNYYYEHSVNWQVCDVGIVIKKDGFIGSNNFFGSFTIFPKYFEILTKKQGINPEDIIKTSTQCAHDFFEFIEALSCKNVSQTIFQKTPNQNVANSRAKSGKLPIYETKILTINTDYQSSGKQRSSTGTHSSPRQHLRRGHIRRLESGNIWVNSCVVGDPNKGKISKTYHVE